MIRWRWSCITSLAAHSATTLVIVCRNCHRRLSDYQKDHSLWQGNPASELEPIRLFLLGLADLFEMLVKRLREFAVKLAALDHAGDSQNGEAQS